LRVVFSAEQIQTRVREMAREIAADYRGKRLCVVCVLENGFVFLSDLIREIPGDVTCAFVRPDLRELTQGDNITTEIFFSPEPDVHGFDALLVEGVVHSGVTTEFLMRHIMGRGAASVKLAALLDRQSARRMSLHPDYVGFLIEDVQVFGYGLGAPDLGRNLPYLAATAEKPRVVGA